MHHNEATLKRIEAAISKLQKTVPSPAKMSVNPSWAWSRGRTALSSGPVIPLTLRLNNVKDDSALAVAALFILCARYSYVVQQQSELIAPIKSLPTEILVAIFEAHVAADQPPSVLLNVCKRWNILSTRTPTLWSRIYITKECYFGPFREDSAQCCRSVQQLHRLLQRAGNATLELVVETRPNDQLFLAALSLLPRCHTINFRSWPKSTIISLPWACEPLPNLQTLEVTGFRNAHCPIITSIIESAEATSSHFHSLIIKMPVGGFDLSQYRLLSARARSITVGASKGRQAVIPNFIIDDKCILTLDLERCTFPFRHLQDIYKDDTQIFLSLTSLVLRRCIIANKPHLFQFPNLDSLILETANWSILLRFETPKLSCLHLLELETTNVNATFQSLARYPHFEKVSLLRIDKFPARNATWAAFLGTMPALRDLEAVGDDWETFKEDFFRSLESDSHDSLRSITHLSVCIENLGIDEEAYYERSEWKAFVRWLRDWKDGVELESFELWVEHRNLFDLVDDDELDDDWWR